jgi:bifunctional DNase/RNase
LIILWYYEIKCVREEDNIKVVRARKWHKRSIGFFVAAGLWVAAFVWLYGKPWAADLNPVVPEQGDLLQVEVQQVVLDPMSKQPVVMLSDRLKERALLMWIDVFVASAIQSELQGTRHKRPLTHDLLENIIQQAGAKIRRIVITHEKANIYYATIRMEKEGKPIEIDARPSDSIVLALKFKIPIYVSAGLFKEKSIPLGEDENIEENYGMSLQDLTPSLARAFSFNSEKGVLVSDVREGSHAEEDGIERGDIFVALEGKAIESLISMRQALEKIETTALARIFRKGQYMSLSLHPN